jgi:glycosyltransferase involved in cell wall biosynthesis
MKILICSPGLTFQADAIYSTWMRADAMVQAGLEVLVTGYPLEYPEFDGRTQVFPYISVQSLLSLGTLSRNARWQERLKLYWQFIIEPWMVKRLAYRIAQREKCDVVYITHVEPWMMPFVVAEQKLRRIWVPTAAMIPTVFYSKTSMQGRPFISRMRGWINHQMGRLLPKWMHVVCNSSYVLDLMNMKIGPQVHVVPEGYERRTHLMGSAEARRSLGISHNNRMLLLFGVASRAKGADLLLKALEGIPPGSFCVYLVGQTGGVYEANWGDLTRLYELGWQSHIHVVPRYVSFAEMEAYYEACDIVIVPYRSGFATTSTHLRMASEYGKAVIASAQYLMQEIVSKYQLGWLFPVEDVAELRRCLREALNANDETYAAIQMKSGKVVEDLSWEKIGVIYRDDLFRKMCSK